MVSTRSIAVAAAVVAASVTTGVATASSAGVDEITLADPAKKEIAMQLVSSAENSSLDWRAQYGYIEDIDDGRGYTAGIIGFCSGTGDMLEVVVAYTELRPDNDLARFLPALEHVNGTDSHEGLDPGFTDAWQSAASDPAFQQAQDDERDRVYFDPAVQQGLDDGVGVLGQFIYYDALVMHGDGDEPTSFGAIRDVAMSVAPRPSDGGDESAYLRAFLDARREVMLLEAAHEDTSRIDTAQLLFLEAGNLDLDPPLDWMVYGDSYHIAPDSAAG
jgi:chitosanase